VEQSKTLGNGRKIAFVGMSLNTYLEAAKKAGAQILTDFTYR